MANPEEQTETDAAGNTNNVFTSESNVGWSPAERAHVGDCNDRMLCLETDL